LGSRSGGSFSSWSGNRDTEERLSRVAEEVAGNTPAQVVVGTAIGVLATTVPVVGTAVAAYHAGKMVYDAIKAGESTYEKTGDSGKALGAVGRSFAVAGAAGLAGQAIGTAVEAGWTAAKPALGVTTNRVEDKVIESAAEATIQEEASKWKRKKKLE
jgi:hypothetical protein